MVTDIVCGMEVGENVGYSLSFEDKKYIFCSQGCRAEFKRRPQDYLKSTEVACCKTDPAEEKCDV